MELIEEPRMTIPEGDKRREETCVENTSMQRREALRKLLQAERTKLGYISSERANHAVPVIKRIRIGPVPV